jgi:hypothetical protein
MKIAKPSGTIRTSDVDRAAMKVGQDLVKMDTNKDRVLTGSEVAAAEKRLHIDGAERKLISKVLANTVQQRGGVDAGLAPMVALYGGERIGGLNHRGVVRAQDLGKVTGNAAEGHFGIDNVAKRLAPDFFEFIQTEEKAGKKF